MNKDNVVQEKSYQLALDVINLIKVFPKRIEGNIVGNQLGRAGTSVGANVEEAIGAFSKEDFIYKMSIALKEARETHYWLRISRDTDLSNGEIVNKIITEAEEVMRILGAIIRSSKK